MKMLKNDFKRYQSHLTDILKGRLEWFEYFNHLEKLRRLQQKANWRLYYQKPVISLLLLIIYLPTKLLKDLKSFIFLKLCSKPNCVLDAFFISFISVCF